MKRAFDTEGKISKKEHKVNKTGKVINLLFILPDYTIGGAERVVEILIKNSFHTTL
ncbi:MAG TPA: hypothetical protein PL101_10085 [Bacteroidales bacterium]|nr:hypothetical protein [Bacteroidales bacterium]HQG78676.1 hypothetical protein [Bacteroidales bacterium]HQK71447.1 hypothetical protein [Bacteroidales bacterium]